MGSHAQALLDAIATAGAILRGEASRNGYNGDTMYLPVGAHPGEEQPPRRIGNAFGKPMILDEMGNLQIFVGKEARETRRAHLPP